MHTARPREALSKCHPCPKALCLDLRILAWEEGRLDDVQELLPGLHVPDECCTEQTYHKHPLSIKNINTDMRSERSSHKDAMYSLSFQTQNDDSSASRYHKGLPSRYH